MFAQISPILERASVEELRTLMHLMIDKITVDSESKSVDKITIKFNDVLNEYLCISTGEEVQKTSSSFVYHKSEMKFIISCK